MNEMDLTFYNCSEGAPEGWPSTVWSLGDDESVVWSLRELTRNLVAFADSFSLEGNVWQHWLTYVLMSHENPFTLACERKEIIPGSTAVRLAEKDLAMIEKYFKGDPDHLCGRQVAEVLNAFTDYKAPHGGTSASSAGSRIASLSNSLADTENFEAFRDVIMEHYSRYGVGIYGIYKAFRVAESESGPKLVPVTDAADVTFDDLIGCEVQKKTLRDNTAAFVSGGFANNVLLYGDSGTGKSTSVHALMHDFFDKGLRLVEVGKPARKLLSQVLSEIKKRDYRFIIYLDDLSFEENESDYKELKAMLEGALETRADRVLIYATSNRRHLIRETWRDRQDMEYQEDIHHSDTMEEKLSLASRFGITIYYSKPDAREYLKIVRELAAKRGISIGDKELGDIARKWELRHGGMSGRTASQLITWLENRALIGEEM